MAKVRATYINAVTVDADDTDPSVANLNTLTTRAQAALATNATFLAIASPSTTQVSTQAKALTRQVDGVIRLLLQQFDSITDS